MVKGIIKVTMFYLLLGVVLFAVSSRLDWWQAWSWLGIMVLEYIIMLFILDPELLAERSGLKQGAKKWDLILATLMSNFATIIIMLIASLDKRFGWSQEISLYPTAAGIILVIAGCVLVTWSMYVNKFFAPLVRIQEDRSHTVCSSGPYRFIRHPGYAGAIITYIVTPHMLRTLWAFIPVGLILIDIVVRTALEDKTLQQELAGYREYSTKTRYRLLPRIW